MGDNIVNNINEILKKNDNGGLTITELVKISKLSRSAVRTALAKLEGAGKVSIRKIGMAKVYSCINQTELKIGKMNRWKWLKKS